MSASTSDPLRQSAVYRALERIKFRAQGAKGCDSPLWEVIDPNGETWGIPEHFDAIESMADAALASLEKAEVWEIPDGQQMLHALPRFNERRIMLVPLTEEP